MNVEPTYECVADPSVDHAPTYCRFHGTDTCRAGLTLDEHNLTAQGWEHPTGIDAKGYWAFGERAINR